MNRFQFNLVDMRAGMAKMEPSFFSSKYIRSEKQKQSDICDFLSSLSEGADKEEYWITRCRAKHPGCLPVGNEEWQLDDKGLVASYLLAEWIKWAFEQRRPPLSRLAIKDRLLGIQREFSLRFEFANKKYKVDLMKFDTTTLAVKRMEAVCGEEDAFERKATKPAFLQDARLLARSSDWSPHGLRMAAYYLISVELNDLAPEYW
jgi:hypothetical protein